MMNKKILILGTILLLSIFLISIISAEGVSYCCEKTLDLDLTTAGYQGGWCMNAPQGKCDTSGDLRAVPTSCEATSYCRLGVCINSQEGTCMPNTPQRVCDSTDGVWDERDKDDIPQCQLGCCLIGEQAAFVTLTRCKSLASDYGLEINYRMDIQSETECIAMARPKVKGACVYEKDYERTCKLTTKKECQEMQASFETEFHEGYLCSATNLSTNCGFPGGTTCVEGRDEVYFLDTCGNLANVYHYSKRNSPSYWEKIMAPTCGSDSNADSTTCGDCDYYLGSTCKKGSASYGNYICKDLGCEDEDFYNAYDRNPEHGETWCANAIGVDESLPGSRHFRLVCYNNEVSVEPCADFRQEVCIQSSIGELPSGGFKTAACRVNIWQDCYSQDNEKDCNNTAKRDCQWIEGVSILKDEEGESLDEDGNEIGGSCVPSHAPGFDFWEEGTDAEDICSIADTTCVVRYEKGLLGESKIVESREGVWGKIMEFMGGPSKEVEEEEWVCLDNEGNLIENWKEEKKNVCSALGDCGISVNYIDEYGYYDEDELFTIIEANEEEEE